MQVSFIADEALESHIFTVQRFQLKAVIFNLIFNYRGLIRNYPDLHRMVELWIGRILKQIEPSAWHHSSISGILNIPLNGLIRLPDKDDQQDNGQASSTHEIKFG